MEPEIVRVCVARFGADSVCPYTRSTASSTGSRSLSAAAAGHRPGPSHAGKRSTVTRAMLAIPKGEDYEKAGS
jgi:hypothetical protein